MADEFDKQVNLEIRRAHSAAGWNHLWLWLLSEPSSRPASSRKVAEGDGRQAGDEPEIDSKAIDGGVQS